MGKTWENVFIVSISPISPRPWQWQTLKYTVDHRLVGILSFETGKDPVSVNVAEPFDVFQPNVHRYLLRPIESNYYIFMAFT